MNNVKTDLDRFASYVAVSGKQIDSATINVTEKYVRQRLKINKKEPLVYRGLKLICRGSPRSKQYASAQEGAK